jgi:hypothetical protein
MSVGALMLFVALFRVQWWPVTNFPMFSYRMTDDTSAGYANADLSDPARARQILFDPSFSGSYWKMRDVFLHRLQLRLAANEHQRELYGGRDPTGVGALAGTSRIHGFALHHALVLTTVADLRAKAEGEVAPRPGSPAGNFLRHYREIVGNRTLDKVTFDVIELLVFFDDASPAVIAREPL